MAMVSAGAGRVKVSFADDEAYTRRRTCHATHSFWGEWSGSQQELVMPRHMEKALARVLPGPSQPLPRLLGVAGRRSGDSARSGHISLIVLCN